MKVVLESYLLSLVTRIYKATTLDKTCRKGFAFMRFQCSFPYTGSLCKKAGQCAKAGIYHGRLRNMYQVHKTFKILLLVLKVPVILQFIQVDFFKEMSWRMLKIPFSSLEIPQAPLQTRPSSTRFQAPQLKICSVVPGIMSKYLGNNWMMNFRDS